MGDPAACQAVRISGARRPVGATVRPWVLAQARAGWPVGLGVRAAAVAWALEVTGEPFPNQGRGQGVKGDGAQVDGVCSGADGGQEPAGGQAFVEVTGARAKAWGVLALPAGEVVGQGDGAALGWCPLPAQEVSVHAGQPGIGGTFGIEGDRCPASATIWPGVTRSPPTRRQQIHRTKQTTAAAHQDHPPGIGRGSGVGWHGATSACQRVKGSGRKDAGPVEVMVPRPGSIWPGSARAAAR